MRFKGSLLAGFLLIFASASQAQLPTAQSTDGLPFYFPAGIFHTSDPLKQREEIMHALQATWVCNQGQGSGVQFKLIAEPDSIVEQTQLVSTSSVTEPNAKMKIILDHQIRLADGRIRVTSLCNQQI